MTLRLNGDSSGFTEIKAPNAAGDNSITLPTSNGGANQLLQNGGTAGALQYTSAGGGLHYDSSGRLLVGTSTARTDFLNTAFFSSTVHIETATTSSRGLAITNNQSGNSEAILFLNKAGGTSTGSTDQVSDTNRLGSIYFQGADGSDLLAAAWIDAQVDGTPGPNVMPGKIRFSTNGGGAAPTPRVEIGSNGALKLLADCPGIDFSATQTNNSGMLSETLDSYEEGVWNVTPTNAVWTVQRSGYVKVGRQVTVFFSGAIASPNAAVPVFPLPFTSDTSTATGTANGIEAHGSIMINGGTPPANTYHATLYIWNSTASVYFSRDGSGWYHALATDLGNGLQFTATYFTN